MPIVRLLDAREPRPISPDLWGVFFEDINHAADGGLYAELVQNRSFEYSSADVPGWGPLTAWSTRGPVRVLTDDPLSPTAPHHVRLGAPGPEAAGAGGYDRYGTGGTYPPVEEGADIANRGFDAIAVRAGQRFVFSVHARVPGVRPGPGARPGALWVTLEHGGAVAEVVLQVAPGPWARYEAEVVAVADDPAAVLRVAVGAGDCIDVDLVSLMPFDVFGHVPNGMRRDLAETVAALRPRFVRFPGGCVAHGLGLENMYRWPTTVGPLHERRHTFNLWGYHQSMGLGYFEYFRFCEQIGATALPVVAAGVCCQNYADGAVAVPDDAMDAYVREVLDLVEFATGGPDTPWGARRAELGHPEPFGLRYLGIGNEDEVTDEFVDRFTRLHDAVRTAYPHVQVVGTAGPMPFGPDHARGWEVARRLGVDLVDEHMYRSPRWYFENVHRYDDHDRGGPGVYVGEYGSKDNRLLNALAEAAFMTGLERNGDVVRLASYAPLLAKAGHTQWTPDLVYFDPHQVMPSVNYWVQHLFSTTAGDAVVDVEVSGAPTFARPAPATTVARLDAGGLRVAFTAVRVNGTAADDVTLGPDDEPRTVPVPVPGAHATLELRATVLEAPPGADGFSVLLGDPHLGRHWRWDLGGWRNRHLTPVRADDHLEEEARAGARFTARAGATYRVRLAVTDDGATAEFALDGPDVQVRYRCSDRDVPEHRFVASCVTDAARAGAGAAGARVRLVNATGTATTVQLQHEDGTAAVARTVTVLGGDPAEGRAFEAWPTPPTTRALPEGCTAVEVPGHALVVVELA